MSLVFPIQHKAVTSPFAVNYAKVFGKKFTGFPALEVIARFKGLNTSWSPRTLMLLDTGASVSLLPIELMERLEINPTNCFEHAFTGVMQRDECKVSAKICRLTMQLEDERGNKSPEWEGIAAFTAAKPLIPLLGMKDCLEYFNLTWNFKAGQVTMKWSRQGNK